jgi:excisionase family DNA binding protein
MRQEPGFRAYRHKILIPAWEKPLDAVAAARRTSILEYTQAHGSRMAKRPTTCGTAEAAKRLGVSRQTLLRWFAQRRITDVRRDHNNWRVFTDQDLDRIKGEVRGNAGAER